MGIYGILLLLVGCFVAGILGYMVACRCDKRARDRDLYRAQLQSAALHCGKSGDLAVIEEEVMFPSGGGANSDSTPDPKEWGYGSLRDSEYVIIPRPIIGILPTPLQAKLRHTLHEIERVWLPVDPYVVTMRDMTPGSKKHFKKDPILDAARLAS